MRGTLTFDSKSCSHPTRSDIEKVLRADPEMLYSLKLRSSAVPPADAAEQEREQQLQRAERENLAEETKALKASYSTLFKSYERLRANFDLMREARNGLAEQVERQRDALQAMYGSAQDLKDVLLEQAQRADQSIAETKGKYDSDTVTIRMNLVKLQNENNSLRSEVESKVGAHLQRRVGAGKRNLRVAPHRARDRQAGQHRGPRLNPVHLMVMYNA